jgi:biotin transport system substrate-specific component
MSVMLCGLALGTKRGALSQLLYVGAGVAGLPVFEGGKFGLHILLGATGGYLAAFAIAAALLGFLAKQGWTRSVPKTAAAMLIGDSLVLTIGALWLSAFIGGKAAIAHGVAPFLVAEIMKAAVVIVALPSAWKLTKSLP